MIDFGVYKNWANAQCCSDCGAKASDRSRDELGCVISGMWATETQCFECFKLHGCAENRGLVGARELAAIDGVVFN